MECSFGCSDSPQYCTVRYCSSVMALHISVPSHHYKTRSRQVSSHRPGEHIQSSDRCINIFHWEVARLCWNHLQLEVMSIGRVWALGSEVNTVWMASQVGQGSLGVTNLKVTTPPFSSPAPRCIVTAVNTGDCWSPPDTRHSHKRSTQLSCLTWMLSSWWLNQIKWVVWFINMCGRWTLTSFILLHSFFLSCNMR